MRAATFALISVLVSSSSAERVRDYDDHDPSIWWKQPGKHAFVKLDTPGIHFHKTVRYDDPEQEDSHIRFRDVSTAIFLNISIEDDGVLGLHNRFPTHSHEYGDIEIRYDTPLYPLHGRNPPRWAWAWHEPTETDFSSFDSETHVPSRFLYKTSADHLSNGAVLVTVDFLKLVSGGVGPLTALDNPAQKQVNICVWRTESEREILWIRLGQRPDAKAELDEHPFYYMNGDWDDFGQKGMLEHWLRSTCHYWSRSLPSPNLIALILAIYALVGVAVRLVWGFVLDWNAPDDDDPLAVEEKV